MPISNARLRLITLAVAGIETLFWLFTFYYIHRQANPRGDGMEWLGEVPLTAIVVILVVPALILAAIGHWYQLATKLAALLVAGALVADAVVWAQLLGEFAHRTAH
jgi:hypothetical protein